MKKLSNNRFIIGIIPIVAAAIITCLVLIIINRIDSNYLNDTIKQGDKANSSRECTSIGTSSECVTINGCKWDYTYGCVKVTSTTPKPTPMTTLAPPPTSTSLVSGICCCTSNRSQCIWIEGQTSCPDSMPIPSSTTQHTCVAVTVTPPPTIIPNVSLELTAPCCDIENNVSITSDFGCSQCTNCRPGLCFEDNNIEITEENENDILMENIKGFRIFRFFRKFQNQAQK